MSQKKPRPPHPGEILQSLAERLDISRVLTDHPEWTAEDLRQALETAAALFRDAGRKAGEESVPRTPWPETIILYADGASRGNPGPAGAGVVVCDEAGNVLGEFSEYLGETTNNVAEYRALLLGLEKAAQPGVRRVLFRCDSELLARQLQGRYKVHSPNLKGLYAEARRKTAGMESFRAEHVPREQNSMADALANAAIDRGG
ncbi:MAG: ribonuclease HI family protein [Nitrospinota bacterium]